MGKSSGSSSRKRTRGDEERAEEQAEERKIEKRKTTPLPTRHGKRRRYATGIDYAAMARSGFDEDVEGGPRARSAATVDYKAILDSKQRPPQTKVRSLAPQTPFILSLALLHPLPPEAP